MIICKFAYAKNEVQDNERLPERSVSGQGDKGSGQCWFGRKGVVS